MSTSFAYHTREISGFQHHSFQYSDGNVIQRLKRKEFRCPKCSHCSVNTYPHRARRIQGLPYGKRPIGAAINSILRLGTGKFHWLRF